MEDIKKVHFEAGTAVDTDGVKYRWIPKLLAFESESTGELNVIHEISPDGCITALRLW